MMDDRDIAQLIALYREERDLWCVSSLDYYKVDKRQEAYDRIYQGLRREFSVEDIKRKIDILRSQYGRELMKTVQKPSDSGDTSAEVYTGLWRFFQPLDSFLRTVYTPRRKSAASESRSKTEHDNTTIKKIKRKPPERSPPPPYPSVSSTAHKTSATPTDGMPPASASPSSSSSSASPSSSAASTSAAAAAAAATAPPSTEPAPTVNTGKKVKPLRHKMEALMDRAAQVLQQFCEQRRLPPRPPPEIVRPKDNDSNDEEEQFGRTVAKRLKKVTDPEERLFLKYTIDSVFIRHAQRQLRTNVVFRHNPGHVWM